MKKIIDDVEKKLKAQEFKLTPKREHILRVMLENRDKHLSAEEIYNLVKTRVPDVGLATVYRALDLFLSCDIIHCVDFGDGRKRYELGSEDGDVHRHHHLICVKCGDVTEVNEDLLEELEERIVRNYNFQIFNHELKVYGLCEKCSPKKE